MLSPTSPKYDLTGCRFGKLTVLRVTGARGGSSIWLCRCDCGAQKEVRRPLLVRGIAQSCGCASRYFGNSNRRTHGLSHFRIYGIWWKMVARCHDPEDGGYERYGARGIRVCDRWRNSLQAFIDDMGHPPERHQIDRENNDGHYEPGNCRWVLKIEQNKNMRRTVFVEIDGRRQCLKDWCRELGKNYNTIRSKIRRGVTPSEALLALA